MKTVNVWWESTWYARFRKLQVLVDGEEFGAVKVGESLVLKVPEGAEELWRKIDWGLTERLDLSEVGSGTAIVFQGRFTWSRRKNQGSPADHDIGL